MNVRTTEKKLRTYEKSALSAILRGRLDWHLIKDFPYSNGEKSELLKNLFQQADRLMGQHAPGREIEKNGRISPNFFLELKKTPFNKLALPESDGGLPLSRFEKFQIFQRIFDHSIAAGYGLAATTGIGLGSLLPTVAEGEAKDLIRKCLQEGAITGFADTEPKGAANNSLSTTAVLSPDGKHYILNGKKIYILNGSVADYLFVTASIADKNSNNSHLFIVDMKNPGIQVTQMNDLMGLRGAPIATLSIQDVKVPAVLKIQTDATFWRDAELLSPLVALGRLYILGAASMSIAIQCLTLSKENCKARNVNGTSLSEFDEIKKRLNSTEAEVFALDTIVQWCLNDSEDLRILERRWELYIAKNITTMTLARIVDRCLSFFGAEGYESAESKLQHGCLPSPIEQFYRDARALRVAGGVDFFVDYQAVGAWLKEFFYSEKSFHEVSSFSGQELSRNLTMKNCSHLQFVQESASKFASILNNLVANHPEQKLLMTKQRLLILINQISTEILMMSLVLGRAAHAGLVAKNNEQSLAEIYCQDTRYRLVSLEAELADELKI